tara:strand:- start:290 stop:631 length:342 start_codon:yes stop_codon:yes gene_type:complete
VKLLFDQNISFRIIKKIQDVFPDSSQVKLLDLQNATDIEIWNFARTNDFTIVTFDSDFSDIVNIKGFPPKIIWLRTGNTTTINIVSILAIHKQAIKDFVLSSDYKEFACLEIA